MSYHVNRGKNSNDAENNTAVASASSNNVLQYLESNENWQNDKRADCFPRKNKTEMSVKQCPASTVKYSGLKLLLHFFVDKCQLNVLN